MINFQQILGRMKYMQNTQKGQRIDTLSCSE